MQYIDCNINPISRIVSYPGATIVQRDTNVEALRFHFSLDAEYELENDSIRIMVLKDGKTNGFNAENVRVETNDGGDEELVFEHTITTHETATPGQIAISVCGNQVSGNNITEAWHTLNMVFQVASAAHSESDEGEDTPETIASNAEKIAALQTLVDAITSGRPIPVDLKSKMTDTSAIYLYTGNETGEQHNYWYYHDGTSWVPGSEYGGMTIDDELSSTSENAVQNKVIKANFDEINGRLDELQDAIGYTTESETPDIATILGTETYPFGWRNGSFDSSTGASTNSSRYIRTITGGENEVVAPENVSKIRAKAPTGRYIAIYEYDSSGTFIGRYGVPNNASDTGTQEVETDATAGYIYKFCIGMTAGSSEPVTDWLTEEFINQIEIEFIMAGRIPTYSIEVDDSGNVSLVRSDLEDLSEVSF